jgi:hypothetical protein
MLSTDNRSAFTSRFRLSASTNREPIIGLFMKLAMQIVAHVISSLFRGMLTLATSRPTLTELVPIPPLEITGRALPRLVYFNHKRKCHIWLSQNRRRSVEIIIRQLHNVVFVSPLQR